MFNTLYPCSKCGKERSATEQQPFCGTCERKYRNQQRQDLAQRKLTAPQCAEGCDQQHCQGCGHHYEAWSGQRPGFCDECSM